MSLSRLSLLSQRSLLRSPSFLASRSLSSSSPAPCTLYHYTICPFCCKTKSILTHLSIPYTTVEVNPLTKSQLKPLEDDGYKKVPIALIGGSKVNGSSTIISEYLSSSPLPWPGYADEDALRWLDWCDSHLAVRIYPALTKDFSSSLQAFSYLDAVPTFTPFEKASAKYVGALAMVMASGKIAKKYNITDVDLSLLEAAQTWEEQLQPFQGGDEPSVADVGVYGVFKGLENAKGEWFDKVMGVGNVGEWYGRMGEIVGEIK